MTDAFNALCNYRQMQARILALATYSVGAGITVSRLNQDDQLQDLHRQLRGLPSYMYLTSQELALESTAHAYLGGKYPTGIKSQYRAFTGVGANIEDGQLLSELRSKIKRVIVARGWDMRDDIDVVLARLAELQDLQANVDRVNSILDALDGYKPDYARLLRLRYIDGLTAAQVAANLQVTDRTLSRWRTRAEAAFKKLSD